MGNGIVAVGVIVVRCDGAICLVRKMPCWGGQWSLPAGYMESGESIHAAAVREAREESGLVVELTHVIRVFVKVSEDGLRAGFTFGGRVTGGELRPDGYETAEAQWFSRDEVVQLLEQPNAFYSPHYNVAALRAYLAGCIYPLDLVVEFPAYADAVSSSQ